MIPDTKKCLIVICGPTASGKTTLAINLAKRYGTEVVSADSRQFYREIPIGTSQPSDAELSEVSHHFIASRSIFDELNAGRFAEDALNLLSGLFGKHDKAILAGGSGLFVDAVCKGLDELPPAPREIREMLNSRHRSEGLDKLRGMLKEVDPLYFSKVDLNNPQRVIRALEVFLATGKPYSSFLGEEAPSRPFRIIKFAIDMDRPELYARINNRVDSMIAAGLVEEARQVYPHRQLKPLQTVGYSELFEYFDGKISLEEAIMLIKRNTRRFAKRQVTWLKRDPETIWLKPSEFYRIPDLVLRFEI